MNGLALCSGIGGIELGLAAAIGPSYRTVCHVEREAYCAGVLAARMQDGALDTAPIWSDLASFDARPWRGVVDIVTAGYPCQPFSLAGSRDGAADPRHLWPHVARIIGECQPGLVFLENVPGHVSLGLREVCADLREMGYDVAAGIFSAAQVGAPHLRKRLFLLAADTNSCGSMHSANIERRGETSTQSALSSAAQSVADPHCDRLRALGNAVVPATAALAFMTLSGGANAWNRSTTASA